MPATEESLQEFVNYCQKYIKGDEKGEGKIFLENFFQAFGHKVTIQEGATFEAIIEKCGKSGKTGFADFLWKQHVLIEMKKRGSNLLDREYRTQAERYYIRIKKDDRPPYVILCNFEQFHIYDFDNQPDDPVDVVLLEDLPRKISAFTFIDSKVLKPIFQNNQVEITEKAARRLGDLLHSLLERGEKYNYKKYTPLPAKRFVLQCVLAMYAEDIGLLPSAIFTRCVKECLEDNLNSYDILGGLFKAMNEPGITPDGKYEGVQYFDGGLFNEIHPIKLEYGELKLLEACAGQDWSKVRPSIFGNLFEGALKYTDKSKEKTKKQRHAHGIHFTSEGDIRSIVLPTIREYWEDKINRANNLDDLEKLHEELVNYTVLDPACGSGNFLYVAYQELKYIEKILLEKIGLSFPQSPLLRGIKRVSPKQFYGMDINPFAVELAKVTLMIGRKVAIDKLGLNEPSLPWEQLDNNIICADALFTEWVKADAIIGNPPFLGSKHIRLTLGDEYVNQLFTKFPDVKDVDFCAYWFRIAHQQLGEKGRAGLVATNSISQGKSRKLSLDYITENQGYIYDAISSQEWSGDAKVHVSLVNWSKIKPEHFVLDGKQVTLINSSLKSSITVTQAVRLKANLNQCFQGVIPIGMGFIIDEETVKDWIKNDWQNQEVLKLFSMGANLAQNHLGKPERWIIDFNEMSLEEASNYQLPFAHIKQNVKPERETNRAKRARDYWWKLFATRPAMRQAIANLSYYFTVPRVSKWAIFIPAEINWLPGDLNIIIASEDYYILGILTSNIHRLWIKVQSSTLKGDTRYTNTTCFETFPFPQTPTKKVVEKIRETMIKIHEYRSKEMEKKGWGITQLYNQYFHESASTLYKFHQELDQLVMSAYHFLESDKILEKLLQLNQECAEKEQQGEMVIGAKDPYS
jgi:SAM-dependent methyltransferase